MITNDADTRNSHRTANVSGEFLRFFGQSVLGEIAAEKQHVCAPRNLSKRFLHLSARMLSVVNISGRGHRQRSCYHRLTNRNGVSACTFRVSSPPAVHASRGSSA